MKPKGKHCAGTHRCLTAARAVIRLRRVHGIWFTADQLRHFAAFAVGPNNRGPCTRDALKTIPAQALTDLDAWGEWAARLIGEALHFPGSVRQPARRARTRARRTHTRYMNC